MTTGYAQNAERIRDLRAEVAGIQNSDQQEILFQEWSPGRVMHKLWSMVDGTEITIPQYMVMAALTKRHPTEKGKYLFTSKKEEAPPYVEGTVRCFLAAGSPERESGLLAAAGLSHLPPCRAQHLGSAYSKRVHAQNRHGTSWAALQEHIQTQEREQTRQEQREQTAAMLRLAGGTPAEPVEPVEAVVAETFTSADNSATYFCDQCDYSHATQGAINLHKARAHREASS